MRVQAASTSAEGSVEALLHARGQSAGSSAIRIANEEYSRTHQEMPLSSNGMTREELMEISIARSAQVAGWKQQLKTSDSKVETVERDQREMPTIPQKYQAEVVSTPPRLDQCIPGACRPDAGVHHPKCSQHVPVTDSDSDSEDEEEQLDKQLANEEEQLDEQDRRYESLAGRMAATRDKLATLDPDGGWQRPSSVSPPRKQSPARGKPVVPKLNLGGNMNNKDNNSDAEKQQATYAQAREQYNAAAKSQSKAKECDTFLAGWPGDQHYRHLDNGDQMQLPVRAMEDPPLFFKGTVRSLLQVGNRQVQDSIPNAKVVSCAAALTSEHAAVDR